MIKDLNLESSDCLVSDAVRQQYHPGELVLVLTSEEETEIFRVDFGVHIHLICRNTQSVVTNSSDIERHRILYFFCITDLIY